MITYGSRLFSAAESNYCVTQKELLAVVYFSQLYRQYLLGSPFVLRTDHAALQWLQRKPEPIGQQARWLESCQNTTSASFIAQGDNMATPTQCHGNPAVSVGRTPQNCTYVVCRRVRLPLVRKDRSKTFRPCRKKTRCWP